MYTTIDFLKDILFPIFCIDCNKEGVWWCDSCQEKFPPRLHQENFSGGSSLDSLSFLFPFQENTGLAKLVHFFKYNFATDVKELWQTRIDKCKDESLVNETMVVVPVPLHPRRERWRGFNQADLVARTVSDRYQLPLAGQSLRRIRATAQQAKLSKDDRQKNVKDAFVWSGGTPVPVEVILVDDVFTTGATMQECARVLKANGARRVVGFVLGRAV